MALVWHQQLGSIDRRQAAELLATANAATLGQHLIGKITGRSLASRIGAEAERLEASSTLQAQLHLLLRRPIRGKGVGPLTYSEARQITMRAAQELGVGRRRRRVLSDFALEQEVWRECARLLCERLASEVERMTSVERAALDAAVETNLDRLPSDQRAAVAAAIGAEQLTGKALRTALVSGGLTGALVGGVQIAGFGAYLALTTAMHALFTTALGITLPFVAYTGATSALSALTGGMAIVPLGALLLLQFKRSANRSAVQLLPHLLTAIGTRSLPKTAGWYADPWSEGAQRYFSGNQWTDRLQHDPPLRRGNFTPDAKVALIGFVIVGVFAGVWTASRATDPPDTALGGRFRDLGPVIGSTSTSHPRDDFDLGPRTMPRTGCDIAKAVMDYTNPGMSDVLDFDEAFIALADVGEPAYRDDPVTQFSLVMLARYDGYLAMTRWGPASDGSSVASGGNYGLLESREATIHEVDRASTTSNVRLTRSGCKEI